MRFPLRILTWLRSLKSERREAFRHVVQKASYDGQAAAREYRAVMRQFTGEGMLMGETVGIDPPDEIRLASGKEHANFLVQGGTGTGKTKWMVHLFKERLRLRHERHRHFAPYIGAADCKEGFFSSLLRTVAAYGLTLGGHETEAVRNSLVVINPFGDYLVPLNVCAALPDVSPEVQSFEIALVLRRLIDTELSSHAENLLRHVLLLLREFGLTLVEAPDILRDEVLRGILAMRSQNEQVREFFLRDYPALPQVSKDSLLNRLRALLLPEGLRLALGADDAVDFRSVLEEGRVLLIFLGKGASIPEEQVNILGSLILQMLFQATYARSSTKRTPYIFMLDEFHSLVEGTALSQRFASALTTFRSYGVRLWMSHHNFSQMSPALRQAIVANADLTGVFRTSADSASVLGDFLPNLPFESQDRDIDADRTARRRSRASDLEAVQRLPDREFYWYDRRSMTRSFRLRTPEVTPPFIELGISENRFEEIIEEQGWSRAGGVSREELRRQISERRTRIRRILNPEINVPSAHSDDIDNEAKQPPSKTKRRRPRIG